MGAQQAPSAQSQLAQYQNVATGLANVYYTGAATWPPVPISSFPYWQRAKSYGEELERLVGKLLAWDALSTLPFVGLFAGLVAARVAERVEDITDHAEFWIKQAAAVDAENAATGEPE